MVLPVWCNASRMPGKNSRNSLLSAFCSSLTDRLLLREFVEFQSTALLGMELLVNRTACLLAGVSLQATLILGALRAAEPVREMIVTNDLQLEKDARLSLRLIVRASYVTVDGNGATLIGAGEVGNPQSL